MTRGNNLNGKYDEWEFTRLNIAWVGTVLDGIFRVRIILGGKFPGASYPGWEFSLVGVSRVGIIRVAIFQVGVFM